MILLRHPLCAAFLAAVIAGGLWALGTIRLETELLPILPPSAPSVRGLSDFARSAAGEDEIYAVIDPAVTATERAKLALRARSALAQLNTELLAQKNAQTQATREAEAARAQLSTVLAASTATATSLGDARTQTATGVATLSAPGLPDSESPPTARLATNRERVAAAANQPAPAATGPRTHLVAPGETLQTIAKKYYGRPERWRVIYAANNAQLSLGRPLEVGTILEVPER